MRPSHRLVNLLHEGLTESVLRYESFSVWEKNMGFILLQILPFYDHDSYHGKRNQKDNGHCNAKSLIVFSLTSNMARAFTR